MEQIEIPLDAGESDCPTDRRVADRQAAWKAEAKALGKLAGAFGPLAKPKAYEDLTKLPRLLEGVAAKTRDSALADRAALLLDEIREDLRERRLRMRQRLARDLNAACRERGLELKVLRSEEPVEVRIPPFAVLIDRNKGKAELRFARLAIAQCEAGADAIMKTHGKALASMRAGFDEARFFDACLRAWKAAKVAGGGARERVEIVDFLPYLAIQLQSRAFRVDPSGKNYRGYSRARFAFDLMQLRKSAGLRRDRWRLNLGVATGTTASKKSRALFVEDEHGNGEFKLTVFFTREEERA